ARQLMRKNPGMKSYKATTAAIEKESSYPKYHASVRNALRGKRLTQLDELLDRLLGNLPDNGAVKAVAPPEGIPATLDYKAAYKGLFGEEPRSNPVKTPLILMGQPHAIRVVVRPGLPANLLSRSTSFGGRQA